jgi:hypothetical protein
MKNYIRILPIALSLALMGCATDDLVSTGSSESESSATIESSSNSFNETQQRINDQMAVDTANAVAAQQFNDAMAAQQLFENQHNAEFNQNSLQ